VQSAMIGDDEDPTDIAEYEGDASEVERYTEAEGLEAEGLEAEGLEAEGHEEYDPEAEVDVDVLDKEDELARGNQHLDEGVENVETPPVDRKAPSAFAPSRGGTSKYSQRYGDPPPAENMRPPRPVRDMKGKGRGGVRIEPAISGPTGAMQIQARQALRHEGDFEDLMSKLDLCLEKLDNDKTLIVNDLDISKNLLTKNQFERLFAMLARDSICVQRFRLFGCPSLDDEVMRLIADWIRESTDKTAPSELHLSDCSITSEGFLHLMCAVEDCGAFPLKQGRTVMPLYLRIENNYIEDSIIQEKVDDGTIMTFTNRSEVTSASAMGSLGHVKIQLLVLARDFYRGKGKGGQIHDKETSIDNLPGRETRSTRSSPPWHSVPARTPNGKGSARHRSPERSSYLGYRSSRSHQGRHSSSGNCAHDHHAPNNGRYRSAHDKDCQSSWHADQDGWPYHSHSKGGSSSSFPASPSGRVNSTHVQNRHQRDSHTSRMPSSSDVIGWYDKSPGSISGVQASVRHGHGSYTRAAGVGGNSASNKRTFTAKGDFNRDTKRIRRPPGMELPPGWEEHFSTEHGRHYYWNRETGDSKWERPR